ncbi:MAG: DUF2891 domain-containing protein [Armatimonadota bacterium]
MPSVEISPELAAQFAQSTLGHVSKEYPHGLVHVLEGPEKLSPSTLHPIFYGSFDWHSCVHGWWQLFRIARLFPNMASEIVGRAEIAFTLENAQSEMGYLTAHPMFERPYGWAWFLALHQEVRRQNIHFSNVLQPIAVLLSSRLKEYLSRLTFPVRSGTHSNTAFALILANEWAIDHDSELKSAIFNWSRECYVSDLAAPGLEPSGEDFLSPTLTEALLMARVLPTSEFNSWFLDYIPSLPTNLLNPVEVSHRSDGRIGHLDGLNFSRAWCWRNLAKHVPSIAETASASADRHFEAAMPHLESNYMSEHWLCTFALLALTD